MHLFYVYPYWYVYLFKSMAVLSDILTRFGVPHFFTSNFCYSAKHSSFILGVIKKNRYKCTVVKIRLTSIDVSKFDIMKLRRLQHMLLYGWKQFNPIAWKLSFLTLHSNKFFIKFTYKTQHFEILSTSTN